MRLHRICHPHRLVRQEENLRTARYALDQVMLDKSTSVARLVATNGCALALVPVAEADEDSPGLIPAAAIKAATSMPCEDDDGRLLTTRIDAGESVRVAMDGVISEYKRENSGRPFPNFDGAFPDGVPVMRVKFDPALLLAISDALGAEAGVELELRSGSKPIVVNPLPDRGIAGRVGLLMPIAAEEAGASEPVTQDEYDRVIADTRERFPNVCPHCLFHSYLATHGEDVGDKPAPHECTVTPEADSNG